MLRIKSDKELGKHVRVRSSISCSIKVAPSYLEMTRGQQKDCGSPAHRRLEARLAERGLIFQSEFRGAIPGRNFRLDIAFPEKRLCVEVDGWQNHGKTLTGFHLDRERQNLLVVNGWRVLRFGVKNINNNVDECIDMICLLLEDKN